MYSFVAACVCWGHMKLHEATPEAWRSNACPKRKGPHPDTSRLNRGIQSLPLALTCPARTQVTQHTLLRMKCTAISIEIEERHCLDAFAGKETSCPT